jgi:cytochrome c heme-lyase
MGQSISSPAASSSPPSSFPVHNSPSSGCPIQHNSPPANSSAGCPVDHSSLNPANQMPNLPQTPIPHQSAPLPTERTMSSIPRAVDVEVGTGSRQTWEYPSPQQFYNALVRKGMETPAEHVETVVEIHNFLNERAWGEVLKWEKRVAKCVHTHWW